MHSLSFDKFYVIIVYSKVIYDRLPVSQNVTVITSTHNLALVSLI